MLHLRALICICLDYGRKEFSSAQSHLFKIDILLNKQVFDQTHSDRTLLQQKCAPGYIDVVSFKWSVLRFGDQEKASIICFSYAPTLRYYPAATLCQGYCQEFRTAGAIIQFIFYNDLSFLVLGANIKSSYTMGAIETTEPTLTSTLNAVVHFSLFWPSICLLAS